jgi:hypothetical protein
MQTQHQRLLDAFRDKTDLMVYEIMTPRPQGLGIAQYNARIKELREMGHQIINVQPGHFRYLGGIMGAGLDKWNQTGKWLHHETDNDYHVLKTKKQMAEDWLKLHPTNIHYDEALKRYEDICEQLEAMENHGRDEYAQTVEQALL